MIRKQHLSVPGRGGPACKGGRVGAGLRGEHIAAPFAEFVAAPEQQCDRCARSKVFAFLTRRAQQKGCAQVAALFTAIADAIPSFEPVADPDAWKAADDALIAARRPAA